MATSTTALASVARTAAPTDPVTNDEWPRSFSTRLADRVTDRGAAPRLIEQKKGKEACHRSRDSTTIKYLIDLLAGPSRAAVLKRTEHCQPHRPVKTACANLLISANSSSHRVFDVSPRKLTKRNRPTSRRYHDPCRRLARIGIRAARPR